MLTFFLGNKIVSAWKHLEMFRNAYEIITKNSKETKYAYFYTSMRIITNSRETCMLLTLVQTSVVYGNMYFPKLIKLLFSFFFFQQFMTPALHPKNMVHGDRAWGVCGGAGLMLDENSTTVLEPPVK